MIGIWSEKAGLMFAATTWRWSRSKYDEGVLRFVEWYRDYHGL
ncbi:MAG: hypothetical protein ACLQME_00865 [Alphaproteobacteria bacterium]